MNCCGSHTKEEEREEVEKEGYGKGNEGHSEMDEEHAKGHSHSAHGGCGMHGGGWSQWLMIGGFILLIAYIFQ